MTLKEFVDIWEDLTDRQVGMNGFSFNLLSQVDSGVGSNYPLLFLEPPDGTVSNVEHSEEVYSINFWVFDLHHENDEANISEKWSECRTLGLQFLKQLRKEQLPEIKLSGPVNIQRGHMMHNDSLIGCKFTMSITIFTDCDAGTFA